ncbi:MAG TPA: FAD-binding oxidoreductase [Azospirillaceae bacterium]|nr:FAD-binding oxidoreductase [Azospirillaceae bacterium]
MPYSPEPSAGIAYPHSYYSVTAHPAPDRPPLAGTVEADVCVIGAGFTGLSAALHLAERGYRVVVLEGARVGWGASGRNGGQMVNGYSRDLQVIGRRYGEAAARALGAMALEGAEIIRERIARYKIACDYKPGNVFAAFNHRQLRAMEEDRLVWQAHGHRWLEMLDREKLRGHVATDAYVGGMIDRRGGHLHPLNLALGEAAAVESRGGVIHENSRVTGIERTASGAVVRTERGQVKACFAVVCGNAYLGRVVPEIAGKIMPVSTQVVATEPLGEDVAKALFPTDVCVEDANYILDYYRLTADRRLLFGGGTVYGGGEPADIVTKLRPRIRRVFPQLADVRIGFAWSGDFALTLARVPHFGRLHGTVYFAHGYSGHGVTTTHLAGRLIAEALDGDATRFDAFANLPYYPFPGGRLLRVPLTVLGAWWYMLRDRLGV